LVASSRTLADQDRLTALEKLAEMCARVGWDGYDALPVSHASLQAAREFSGALPEEWPVPEISADPDGGISFEWARSPHWVFTLSVASDRQVSYAGLFGSSRVHGVEPFSGTIPGSIRDGLGRLFRNTAAGPLPPSRLPPAPAPAAVRWPAERLGETIAR